MDTSVAHVPRDTGEMELRVMVRNSAWELRTDFCGRRGQKEREWSLGY